MAPTVHAKTTYRIQSRLERFYTGGSVCATADETCVVCACGDEVKVSFAASAAQALDDGCRAPQGGLLQSPVDVLRCPFARKSV